MSTKIALCVGINDYPGTGADLQGCVNDAVDWGAALQARGYQVRYLFDGEATRDAITKALWAAAEETKWRGKFVFQYSGHGTWVPDQDGDEKDARDEALVCHDWEQGGLLTDDKLHSIFSRFRYGTSRLIISDSCHSGTIARDLLAMSSALGKPRFISPAFLPTVDIDRDEAVRREMVTTKAFSRTSAVLMSGCDDPEYSYDAYLGYRFNGAFSRTALDVLHKMHPRSMKEWHAMIRQLLPSAAYPQSPQLQASYYQGRKAPLT